METFKGDPKDQTFQEWLRRVTRNKRNVIVIATDGISCFEARTILKQTSSLQYPFTLENIQKAVVHLMTCEKDQRCRQFFQNLKGQLKDS